MRQNDRIFGRSRTDLRAEPLSCPNERNLKRWLLLSASKCWRCLVSIPLCDVRQCMAILVQQMVAVLFVQKQVRASRFSTERNGCVGDRGSDSECV